MASGWFVFALVACVVLCSGLVLAAAVIRAAWAQREKESLTAGDLKALEESAVVLIEQLKSEADRGISELDERFAALHGLILEADRRLAALGMSAPDQTDAAPPAATRPRQEALDARAQDGRVDRGRILELASSGLACADIAKATGLDCAEVNLVVSLGKTEVKGLEAVA
jgi:hypothetical protein